MKDIDKMPFGKHKGTSMANVPAEYLLWLYSDIKTKNNPFIKPIKDYIEENLDVLNSQVASSKPFFND